VTWPSHSMMSPLHQDLYVPPYEHNNSLQIEHLSQTPNTCQNQVIIPQCDYINTDKRRTKLTSNMSHTSIGITGELDNLDTTVLYTYIIMKQKTSNRSHNSILHEHWTNKLQMPQCRTHLIMKQTHLITNHIPQHHTNTRQTQRDQSQISNHHK